MKILRSTAAAALFLCLSAPAFAQMSVGGGGTGVPGEGPGAMGGNGGMSPAGVPARAPQGDDDSRGGGGEEKPIAPPPAIPGAQPDEDAAVAPADRLAAEMSPNDALFDAISRGDMPAAKDALNRGAQLDAHNVLGQTPTDASIDLDRNDITFLLLSMRTTSGTTTPAASVTTDNTATTRGKKGHVIPASAHTSHPQLSTNRGAPNPAVGFIGF